MSSAQRVIAVTGQVKGVWAKNYTHAPTILSSSPKSENTWHLVIVMW